MSRPLIAIFSSRKLIRFWLPLFACILVFYLIPIDPAVFSNVSTPSFIPYKEPTPPSMPPKVVLEDEVATPTRPNHEPLEKHRYREDGLVEVNSKGPHPIYELIRDAEKKWQDKLDRQSRSLEDAVEEYKRRYRRAPPKGFDVWWKYVTDNDVRLPDEYDQIHEDLEGFWGIEPTELQATQKDLEEHTNSFTIGQNVTGGISVLKCMMSSQESCERASADIVELLQPIVKVLPPFRITISADDRPNRHTDYGIKSTYLKAASEGRYVAQAQLPKKAGTGWRFACPPDSPARQNPVDIHADPTIHSVKTFIHDHIRSMDPCQHTSQFLIHGQYISHEDGPGAQDTLVPEFSHCSTPLHHDIRLPSPYGWVKDMDRAYDPPFMEKRDDRLLWRGRNTGIAHTPKTIWRNMQRNYLMRTANQINGTLHILQAKVSASEPVGEPLEVRRSRFNPAMMDVAYVDKPSCEGATCQELEKMFPWRPYQDEKEAGRYKYVFDADGNGWSGRFKRLMTTNSLVFKSTIYPEWYHDRVQPWVHYIPIQLDLSDLHDALIFFRGDGNGQGAHEELGEKIAHAGRKWSLTFWRKEDLTAYFFRLLLEYARLSSANRAAMSFTFPVDQHH